MSEYKVASRYAKSLIDISKEHNSTDSILGDINVFQKTVKDSIALQSLLKNPVVNIADKKAVLHKLFDKSFNKTTLDFFDIVVGKNRSNVLSTIADTFVEQYNTYKNIIEATVKTAQPIDAAVTAEITQFIEKQSGKKVVLKTVIDPSLIGGLVIQIGDDLYDASIAGKINKIKQNLLNTYISK